MEFFAVKNFKKFQHYSDRTPPWIKLYQEFLSDYKITLLTPYARLYLSFFYLLASRTDNQIPFDINWIKIECHCQIEPPIDELLEAGFIRKIKVINKDLDDDASKNASGFDRERRGEERRIEIEREREEIAIDGKKPNPEIKLFIDHYFQEYQKAFGKKYLVQGAKDSTAVKTMIGSIGLDDMKKRLPEFFEDKLAWMNGSPNHTISIFLTQINKYGKTDKYPRSKGVDPVDPALKGKTAIELMAIVDAQMAKEKANG